MSRFSLRLGLFACFVLAARAAGEEPRVDAHGDPLPRFARARLGTTRFRCGTRIESVSFSPDGRTILSIGAGVARLWDTATGKETRHFRLPERGIGWVLTSDKRTLATYTDGPEVRVWDSATGKRVHTLTHDGHALDWVRFTPDDKFVAAVASNSVSGLPIICVWDLASGKKRQTIAPSPPAEGKAFKLS